MKYEDPYLEAMRYIENAELQLKQAGKEDKFYIDEKYVHAACGIAYIGMLKALDSLFDLRGVPKKKGRKAIEYYKSVLSGLDKKLLNNLNSAYNVLHLVGNYDGEKKIKVIEEGFESATTIVTALKPFSKNGQQGVVTK